MPSIETFAPQNDDVAKQIRDLLITARGEDVAQRLNMATLIANTAPLLERKVDIGSTPFAPPADFRLKLAQGLIPGMKVIHKFGHNPLITQASDPEDVWDAGGIWVAPTAPRIHQLVSSSTADNGVTPSTGAREIEVFGLDRNGVEAFEFILMNGQSNVPTVREYIMIYRMSAVDWGSGEVNAGAITATADTDSTVTASITATNNQTGMAIYQIPADHEGYMTNFWGSLDDASGNSGDADLDLLVSHKGHAGFQITQFHGLVNVGSSHFNHTFPIPQRFEALDTLKMHVPTVSGNVDIAAGFDLILVNKDVTAGLERVKII